MRDNSLIYKKVLIEGGLDQVKYLRDAWNYSPQHPRRGEYTDLTCVCGHDADQYSFIMEETKKKALDTIVEIVFSLLAAYNIEVMPVQLSANDIVFAHTFVHNGTIYIFRRFGIQNRYPEEVIQKLKEGLNVSDYKYIIPMEGDAFAEVINHDDNEEDPSRGTHSYTLKFFFSQFFGEDEYIIFKQYYGRYIENIRNYFGISVVKTLQPNALFSYKRFVLDKLQSFDYQKYLQEICPNPFLSQNQKAALDKQFFDEGYLATLIGEQSFATCFMTAEWLFDSLSDTGGEIDYTCISMGYFKALEQFLYDFVGFHTSEKDGKLREIKFKREGDPEPFTNDKYLEHRNDCMIGTLAKYLYNYNQRDLFRPEINQYTVKILRELLSKASVSRNGFFHKDNIEDWEKVKKDRTLTFLLFYFILGAYKFEGDAYEYFGFEPPLDKDDTEKLFEYFHKKSFMGEMLERPIIYFGEDKDKYDFYVPAHDSHIVYDKYGNPEYSGLYFYRLGKSEFTQKIGRDEIPNIVCEGRFILGRKLPIDVTLTGPERVVFRDGKFFDK